MTRIFLSSTTLTLHNITTILVSTVQKNSTNTIHCIARFCDVAELSISSVISEVVNVSVDIFVIYKYIGDIS